VCTIFGPCKRGPGLQGTRSAGCELETRDFCVGVCRKAPPKASTVLGPSGTSQTGSEASGPVSNGGPPAAFARPTPSLQPIPNSPPQGEDATRVPATQPARNRAAETRTGPAAHSVVASAATFARTYSHIARGNPAMHPLEKHPREKHPLDGITAADLMETEVLSLSPGDSVEDAILELEEAGIAGAPVLDAGRHVRGVFSLSDVARLEASVAAQLSGQRSERVMLRNSGLDVEEDEAQEDELMSMDHANTGVPAGATVGEWMTAEIVTVSPEATLVAVCRVMQAHRVHRVLVVVKGELRGVVSTMDIVTCLAQAL